MKKQLAFIVTTGLVACMAATAQTGRQNMRKFDTQLPQTGRGNVRVAYQSQSIDRMIYEFMEEEGIPGLTLAIVQAPYIPRIVGYGVADTETGRLASAKTLWPVGPISQAFAAVAAVQLYEKGRLDIDKPLGSYLKNLPESWQPVTVRQLMQHSSGIPDYRDAETYDSSRDYTPEELTELAAGQPRTFAPGTAVRPSATNFLLLASVIEKAGRTTYRDFVRKYQFDCLGLRHIYFNEELDQVRQEELSAAAPLHSRFKHDPAYIDPAETSTGYREEETRLIRTPARNHLKGFADIWASAEDISHWDIALAGGVLIEKPENRDILYKPGRLSDGTEVPAMAGWHFYGHKGLMDIKGSRGGHSVFLSRFTDASELVCVTLLANKEQVDFTNLARKIAAAFDPEKLGTGSDDRELFLYESQFGADITAERIIKSLRNADIPVFAVFDHAKNAAEAGLSLLPTKVIVFGSPKVGTKLMQENPSIAIELPLKISVWEDRNGSVWAAFPQMHVLAARYGMQDHPVIGNMQKLLEKIVRESAALY